MVKPKLEYVELYHVRMRLRQPFQTSFGIEHDRQCVLIGVGSGGVHGWGECVAGEFPGYSYETAETAWHVLQEFFIPALDQSQNLDPSSLREALSAFRGHPLARAGLEMALWDLLGKQLERPLHAIIGGQHRRVPVGVSIGIQETSAQMLDRVEMFLDLGYQRIKLKIKPGADVGIVKSVREKFPDIRLQVDANSAYRLEDKTQLKKLDNYSLELIEQPLAEDDILDHAQLQSELATSICLDESILNLRHTIQAINADACRIINIKPGRVGGLSEARAIHDYCLRKGIPVWCGGMLETNVGRAANLALATLPGFSLHSDISASDRYYEVDVAQPNFSLNPDSTIDVPETPGLGIEVDRKLLDRFIMKKDRLEFS